MSPPLQWPVVDAPDANQSTDSLRSHLSATYRLTQTSGHVFASPLGPFFLNRRQAYLPRFVFFGPHASDESWRVAFLAGFDARDLRSSHALLSLVARLTAEAETGNGLHLTFFPIVDAGGAFLDVGQRWLGARNWGYASAPEIDLLERDARLNSYHGFVRIETAPPGEEIATIRISGPVGEQLSPDLEVITTEDTDPLPIRFEAGLVEKRPVAGPLSIEDDLGVAPFELTLRVPSSWPDETYSRAVVHLLQRFLWRYRAFQAYGQHL